MEVKKSESTITALGQKNTKGITDQDLKRLQSFADLLDNKFVIPGTNFRFGLDSLIGVIPYVGDVFTFLLSSYLLILISRRGTGSWIVIKMMWNMLVDFTFGSIPLVGDIFDIGFRANLKNIKLAEENLRDGKHKGSAWPALIFIFVFIISLLGVSVWLLFKALYWIFS